jgi:prepilin-type N-terminal cleavage/methylation domain-containing protein
MILQNRESRAARRAAFTLMEVLVVAVILVIMAGTATVAVFKYMEDARKDRAQMDVVALAQAVKTYALKNQGQFPDNLDEVLQYIETGNQSNLMDQWNNRYQYTVMDLNGQKVVKVWTTAPDGQEISNVKQ